jgi:alkylhydroperoxidase/carboxymuconolactone decarboxylase family protein YurZ
MTAKRKPSAKKKPAKRPILAEPPRAQSEAAQAALAEAERLFRSQAQKSPAQKAAAHFAETLGEVPASVQALIDLAPGALPGYVALREFAYGGALDRRTVELLFTVLDVVEGHTEAAKAHVEEAVKAGLTVPQLAEALTVAMMVSGISTFATSGHHVLRHAAAAAEERR